MVLYSAYLIGLFIETSCKKAPILIINRGFLPENAFIVTYSLLKSCPDSIHPVKNQVVKTTITSVFFLYCTQGDRVALFNCSI